jgi:hypothetical protein
VRRRAVLVMLARGHYCQVVLVLVANLTS